MASSHAREISSFIQAIVAAILQIFIFGLAVVDLVSGHWLNAFAASTVFLLTFFPAILERQLRVHIPIEWTLLTCLFLFASYALGEIQDFYARFWWWDLMLHSLSALTMGIIGFLMIYVFYMTNRIRIPPLMVSILTFSLSVTMGVLWEIFEFCMDWFFGLNMQKSGLVDTMTDLIVDALGSFVAALLGYFYVKNGDSLIVDGFVENFVAENAKLFKLPPNERDDLTGSSGDHSENA